MVIHPGDIRDSRQVQGCLSPDLLFVHICQQRPGAGIFSRVGTGFHREVEEDLLAGRVKNLGRLRRMGGVGENGEGDGRPDPRQFLHAPRLVERPHAGDRPPAGHRLRDEHVLVRVGGDLGQVGHAEDLPAPRGLPELLPHHLGDAPADPRPLRVAESSGSSIRSRKRNTAAIRAAMMITARTGNPFPRLKNFIHSVFMRRRVNPSGSFSGYPSSG